MPRQCMILPNISSLSKKREHFRIPAVNAEKQTSYSVRSTLIITVLCGNKSTFIIYLFYFIHLYALINFIVGYTACGLPMIFLLSLVF